MTTTGGAAAKSRSKRPAIHEAPMWLESVPVRGWMTRPAVTIHAHALARGAAELMKRRKLRHLPVVDRRQRLVGIVTDRDLRQVLFDPAIQERLGNSGEALKNLPVSDIMTWGVVAVGPMTELREAAWLMHEQKIGALPVIEHNRVVGMLTERDVLRAFHDSLGERVRPVRAMRQPGRSRPYEYGFLIPVEADPWRDEGSSG